MIRRLPSCGAGHVLNYDGRLSGNILSEKRDERSRLHVARASGLAAPDDFDGFPLVIGKLRERNAGRRTRSQQQEKDCAADFFGSHISRLVVEDRRAGYLLAEKNSGGPPRLEHVLEETPKQPISTGWQNQ